MSTSHLDLLGCQARDKIFGKKKEKEEKSQEESVDTKKESCEDS